MTLTIRMVRFGFGLEALLWCHTDGCYTDGRQWPLALVASSVAYSHLGRRATSFPEPDNVQAVGIGGGGNKS